MDITNNNIKIKEKILSDIIEKNIKHLKHLYSVNINNTKDSVVIILKNANRTGLSDYHGQVRKSKIKFFLTMLCIFVVIPFVLTILISNYPGKIKFHYLSIFPFLLTLSFVVFRQPFTYLNKIAYKIPKSFILDTLESKFQKIIIKAEGKKLSIEEIETFFRSNIESEVLSELAKLNINTEDYPLKTNYSAINQDIIKVIDDKFKEYNNEIKNYHDFKTCYYLLKYHPYFTVGRTGELKLRVACILFGVKSIIHSDDRADEILKRKLFNKVMDLDSSDSFNKIISDLFAKNSKTQESTMIMQINVIQFLFEKNNLDDCVSFIKEERKKYEIKERDKIVINELKINYRARKFNPKK